jgi:uncharacterized protein (TIGR01732 family)
MEVNLFLVGGFNYNIPIYLEKPFHLLNLFILCIVWNRSKGGCRMDGVGAGGGFALIVVLFILLIIIAASFMGGGGFY